MASLSSWHVAVAAEAIAAAQFARCGLDVSVQYGANQPEYDLVVVKGERLMRVSVKGSQDGGWGLTQSYLKRADYHAAIDAWLRNHKRRTVFCFVQLKGVALNEMARVYLATPDEVADQLRRAAKGRGETVLWEHKAWTARAQAAGTVDRIPDAWTFTLERVRELLHDA